MAYYRKLVRDTELNKKKKIIRFLIVTVIAIAVVVFIFKIKNCSDYKNIEETKATEVTEATNSNNEKKPLSAKLVSLSDMPIAKKEVSIKAADADTFLISSSGKEYKAQNMIDGDLKTSWQEGSDAYGIGNKLYFTFDIKIPSLNYIEIYNGNHSSEKNFDKNCRIKKAHILINDESAEIEFQDTMEPQIIKLKNAKNLQSFTIEILEVYPGTKTTDTCITEVKCFAID